MTMPPMPPHDIDAEMAVVGSLLIDGESIDQVLFLKPGDFFRETHGAIFEAMLHLHNQNESINEITVAHEMARTSRLETYGGAAYLAHLIAEVPTSVHVAYYADIVKRTAVLRRYILMAGQLAKKACDQEDLSKITSYIASEVADLQYGPTRMAAVTKAVRINSSPPIFTLTVNSTDIPYETEELLDQKAFREKVIAYCNFVPVKMKPDQWDAWINGILQMAEKSMAPTSASTESDLREAIERFFSRHQESDEHQDVLAGAYCVKEHNGQPYSFFMKRPLTRFLKTTEGLIITSPHLWAEIKRMGGVEKNVRLKTDNSSISVKCWGIPAETFEDVSDEELAKLPL